MRYPVRNISVSLNKACARWRGPFTRACFLCAFVFLIAPQRAEAYVDPGTGGLVYQMLILFVGLIAGYLAFLKKYIKSLFSSKRSEPSDDTQE